MNDLLMSLPDQGEFFKTLIYLFVTYYKVILFGLGITVLLSVVGTVGGFFLAIGLTGFRTLEVDKKRDTLVIKILKVIGQKFAVLYVTVFRGTPMIVQAMIIFYGVAQANLFSWWAPLPAGLIIVTLNTTAYISEVLRGGLESLDVGQMEAARSVGMTKSQAMRHVMWPQAIKNALPGIGNEFVVNLKDTAVLSVISVVDLFYAVRQSASESYRFLEAFMIAAIMYLILTYLSSKLINYLSRRMSQTGEANL
ncbi:Amino acid ABC transporter, permease subunit [Paracholeplasma brassicae]|uniref:Amino acid ABC transporter, permease subunit n=1 Tax=Acholeplasma brassicae TaxID=61635 RepID=U4KSV3_9MOLU|nr:amino acid ABC transporter permease [Paracholeplasma brassicae]CCV65589.1 Amino acid ABC transporter, permease subunit [Paracholeplasma brassicae]